MRVYTYGVMKSRLYLLLAGGVVATTAVVLFLMGRIPMCACGRIEFWYGLLGTAEDSQHLLDWYSASHFIHGIIFFGLLYLLFRKMSVAGRFLIAVSIEAGWEILENSSIIINRYRETTMAAGYGGDSIVNSLVDIACMALGFVFARYVPIWVAVLMVIFLEVLVGYLIHDNLFLNILMLTFPLETVSDWQAS